MSHQPQPHAVELREHSGRTECTKKKCVCPLCPYSPRRSRDLKIHMLRMHETITPKYCCGVAFVTKADLQQHKKTCLRYKYNCSICARNYSSQRLLRRHINDVHDFKKFKCSHCSYASTRQYCITLHVKRVHKLEYFSSILQSPQHDQPSPEDDTNDTPRENLTTEFFGVKDLSANIDITVNSHCVSSSSYDEPKNLYPQDELDFVDVLDIPMNCNIPSLPQVITECTKKKCACPLCPYSPRRSRDLKIHMLRMHEAITPKYCCGVAFVTKADLQQHKKTCLRFKYNCSICARNYSRQRLLRRHINDVHDFKKFKCSHCPYASTRQFCIKLHAKRVHKLEYFSSILQSPQHDRPSPEDDTNDMPREDLTTEFFGVKDLSANINNTVNSHCVSSSSYDEPKNLYPQDKLDFVDVLDISMNCNIPSLPQVITDPLSIGVEETVSNEVFITGYKKHYILLPLMNTAPDKQRLTDVSSSFDKNSLLSVANKQSDGILVPNASKDPSLRENIKRFRIRRL